MSSLVKSIVKIISLKLADAMPLTSEQFLKLCQNNPDYKFEKSALGELLIRPPTGGETGIRNMDLSFQLQSWNRQYKKGVAFDSSTCFQFPNGANRSPNAAWIQRDRLG